MANGNGWLKISRKLNEHWIWQDERKLKWWLDLLLMTKWKAAKESVEGVTIKIDRGEQLISIRALSKRWGCSRRQVENFIADLSKDKMVCLHKYEPKASHDLSHDLSHPKNHQINILTICNFDKYQGFDIVADIPSEPRIGSRTEPYDEEGNKEEENNTSTIVDILQKKIFCFKNMVEPFRLQYGSDMVDDFIAYWTEPTKSGKLIRFDLERTWDTKRRLGTWERNNRNKYGNANNRTSTGDGAAQRAADAARLVNELLEQ